MARTSKNEDAKTPAKKTPPGAKAAPPSSTPKSPPPSSTSTIDTLLPPRSSVAQAFLGFEENRDAIAGVVNEQHRVSTSAVAQQNALAPCATNVVNLSNFGLTPPTNMNSPYRNKSMNRSSVLKIAIIRGPGNSNEHFLVFRCERNDSPVRSAWSEKLFFDMLRNKETWMRDLCFEFNTLPWYDNDVEMKNERDFNIRLFIIQTGGFPPSEDRLVELGKFICSKINAINEQPNNGNIQVDEANYFWFGRDHKTVWYDVVGTRGAKKVS